jgi:hypothetical protein
MSCLKSRCKTKQWFIMMEAPVPATSHKKTTPTWLLRVLYYQTEKAPKEAVALISKEVKSFLRTPIVILERQPWNHLVHPIFSWYLSKDSKRSLRSGESLPHQIRETRLVIASLLVKVIFNYLKYSISHGTLLLKKKLKNLGIYTKPHWNQRISLSQALVEMNNV